MSRRRIQELQRFCLRKRIEPVFWQALKVTGSSDRAADDSIVQAEITSPNQANGQSIRVAFRVRPGETGASTITDILIEGVSLATTERDEFTAYLQQHEGHVSDLSKRLNGMTQGQLTN